MFNVNSMDATTTRGTPIYNIHALDPFCIINKSNE